MKKLIEILFVLVAFIWIGSKLGSGENSAPAPATTTPSYTAATSVPLNKHLPPIAAEKKDQQEKRYGAETIVAAKRAVRESLKDPNSAEFKDVYANYTEEFDVVACGKVNAKNDFGGYTGFKRFVSSGQRLILEGRDNLTEAWARACQ